MKHKLSITGLLIGFADALGAIQLIAELLAHFTGFGHSFAKSVD